MSKGLDEFDRKIAEVLREQGMSEEEIAEWFKKTDDLARLLESE